jgi:hypothetical protein
VDGDLGLQIRFLQQQLDPMSVLLTKDDDLFLQ